MSKDSRNVDPDDFFADTRMSFGDHIEDLRTHLWRAIKGFFVACLFGFFFGRDVLAFIARPVEQQLQAFYDRRVQEIKQHLDDGDNEELNALNNKPSEWSRVSFPAGQLRALFKNDFKAVNGYNKPDDDEEDAAHLWMRIDNPVRYVANLQHAQNRVGRRPALSTLSVQEAFMVYLKVSLVTGFVLGAPWIFYQVWSFIAVGLYPHEKRYVNVYLPVSIGLFVFGVLICEFFVIPRAIEALLWFNEWLGFAILMPVIFGISFQTPLVMLFLNKIGIMDASSYREKRRIVWLLMAVFAAIATPSTDPYSMIFLWVPMCLLFELGIWLCMLAPPPAPWDLSVPDSEEVVEV